MHNRSRKIFNVFLPILLTVIFSFQVYADLNFGIVNAIKKQAKPLTDKRLKTLLSCL